MEREDSDLSYLKDFDQTQSEKKKNTPASTFSRIGAYIVDNILLFILNFLIFFTFIQVGILSWGMFTGAAPGDMFLMFQSASYLVLMVIGGLISLTYFIVLESEKGGGATLGKKVMGIKVVDDYGQQVNLLYSLIRNIARLLWQIPCIGLIILIIDVVLIAESDQRIGDKLAYTYVVEESNMSDKDYSQYEGAMTEPGKY